jgi:EAL domain-containing protein (putative c-di-GMP-specific phosphodiesterase class I)
VNVVAEGIERESQRQQLAALGCHAGQGYLFSRPLAINDTLNFIAEHGRSTSCTA